jgi:hypothetical protein
MIAGASVRIVIAVACGSLGLYVLLHVSGGRRDVRLWAGITLLALSLVVIGEEVLRHAGTRWAAVGWGVPALTAVAATVVTVIVRRAVWSLGAFAVAGISVAATMIWSGDAVVAAGVALILAAPAAATSMIVARHDERKQAPGVSGAAVPHEPALAAVLWGLLTAAILCALVVSTDLEHVASAHAAPAIPWSRSADSARRETPHSASPFNRHLPVLMLIAALLAAAGLVPQEPRHPAGPRTEPAG